MLGAFGGTLMARSRQDMSTRDLESRSKFQGGDHTLSDVHRGPRTGPYGAVHRGIYGDSPEDFDKAIELEWQQRQRHMPDRFVNKIAPRSRPRRKAGK